MKKLLLLALIFMGLISSSVNACCKRSRIVAETPWVLEY